MSLKPRQCPSCAEMHPPLTTCATGWAPWDGQPIAVDRIEKDVILTDAEVAYALELAEFAEQQSLERGYSRPYDTVPSFEAKLHGFAGEIAAARATGLAHHPPIILPPTHRKSRKAPDLGRRTDVKVRKPGARDLIVDQGNPAHFAYLLVTGRIEARRFTLVGWQEGRILMASCYWRTRPAVAWPSWWVPRADLERLPLPDDA